MNLRKRNGHLGAEPRSAKPWDRVEFWFEATQRARAAALVRTKMKEERNIMSTATKVVDPDFNAGRSRWRQR